MSDDMNPYGQLSIPKSGAIMVEENRAMAEVKAQVFMARQFPRDAIAATDRILAECGLPPRRKDAVMEGSGSRIRRIPWT